jgi:hypothetical protein
MIGSMPRSRARTLRVRAPTEMMSTPFAAVSRIQQYEDRRWKVVEQKGVDVGGEGCVDLVEVGGVRERSACGD